MVGHIREHPGAGLVYCDFQVIDESGRVTGRSQVQGPEDFRTDPRRLSVCALWPRSVRDEVGGFDPDFDTAEDYEYWLRIARHHPIHKCGAAALLYFRTHDQQGSSRFAVRQEYVHWAARIQYCEDHREARRLRGRCYAEVAYIHRTDGRTLSALGCLMISLVHWPFSWTTYRRLVRTLGDPLWWVAGGVRRLIHPRGTKGPE
jgi:hypothetical protein